MSSRLLPVALSLLVLSLPAAAFAQAADDELDDPEKAVKRYAKVVEKAPDDAAAWYALGRAYVQLKQWPEALKATARAVELAPLDAKTHFRSGEALAGSGQQSAAIQAFEKAVELDPTMTPAHAKLASAYAAAKRWDDAIRVYKKALEAEPKDKAAYYTNLGDAYYKKGDPAEAVRWFEKTVELAPASGVTYFNLGAIYRRLGKEDAAMLTKSAESFAKAADIDTRDARTQFLAGESMMFAGRKVEAKKYLDRYLALDPDGAKLKADDHQAAKLYLQELAK